MLGTNCSAVARAHRLWNWQREIREPGENKSGLEKYTITIMMAHRCVCVCVGIGFSAGGGGGDLQNRTQIRLAAAAARTTATRNRGARCANAPAWLCYAAAAGFLCGDGGAAAAAPPARGEGNQRRRAWYLVAPWPAPLQVLVSECVIASGICVCVRRTCAGSGGGGGANTRTVHLET